MVSHSEHKHLTWFLGPKAENSRIFERLITEVVQDYAHWRKNYFPDDPLIPAEHLLAAQEEQRALLETQLARLLARLRRNFPFYSPRYIAHELSETMVPTMLGYIAGMMYNPNNVTPEAAPVTTELEIEVTDAILRMVGYKPPPDLPAATEDRDEFYTAKGKQEYGWAHLTSGGTIANIEALWVARQIRYFPLAVKHAALHHKMEIALKLPNGTATDVRDVDDYQLLLIRPNEAIYLLGKLASAFVKTGKIDSRSEVVNKTWQLLDEAPNAISKGLGPLLGQFPALVLVAGSQHYSVSKAANVVGIGQANVRHINMDSKCRMDVEHLRHVLVMEVLAKKKVPLCVIANAGTTEEGAVDPIHEIVDLRSDLESKHLLSFWLHIDAAWGGYMRSLFNLEEFDRTEALCASVARSLKGVDAPTVAPSSGLGNLIMWHAHFANFIRACSHAVAPKKAKLPKGSPQREPFRRRKPFPQLVSDELDRMADLLEQRSYPRYRKAMRVLLSRFGGEKIGELIPGVESWLQATGKADDPSTFFMIADWLRDYVRDSITLDSKNPNSKVSVSWPSNDVASAFLSFPKAESITIDPHKMGFSPYPAGCIAFRNDLVRSFILQEAPYITSAKQNAIHVPPRHADHNGKIITQSFAPFILEGSRPGATAAGLWLAMNCVPYTPRAHGIVVRSSLLSARLLYEGLTRWKALGIVGQRNLPADFVPLVDSPPDTNLVAFAIKPHVYNSLEAMNKLTEQVYKTFAIEAELGARKHSYSQPFFLSKTCLRANIYTPDTLEEFFRRCGLSNWDKEYRSEGLLILRAAVMTPYILSARVLMGKDFIEEFLKELLQSSEQAVQELVASHAAEQRKARSV